MIVEISSLKVTLNRALEVISAFAFIMMVLCAETITVMLWIAWWYYGSVIMRTLWLIYFAFMIYDFKAGVDSSRRQGSRLIRGLSLWKYFTQYFPIKLVKTADLPANKNYIFACYPHGVLCMGIFGNFATSTTPFAREFPGIRSKICTLNYHFYVPVFREVALGWGMTSASSKSIENGLRKSNDPKHPYNSDGYTSNAMVILIGGAREALLSKPGVYHIILKPRKGFIKMAIKTGASIVPVFSFGEVDVYDQMFDNKPGTLMRKFQEKVKQVTGIAPAFFIGRGFFQESFGLIPLRRPVTTLIGAPIDTIQDDNPSQETINEYHEKFSTALQKLFNDHKPKYIKNYQTTSLIIE